MPEQQSPEPTAGKYNLTEFGKISVICQYQKSEVGWVGFHATQRIYDKR